MSLKAVVHTANGVRGSQCDVHPSPAWAMCHLGSDLLHFLISSAGTGRRYLSGWMGPGQETAGWGAELINSFHNIMVPLPRSWGCRLQGRARPVASHAKWTDPTGVAGSGRRRGEEVNGRDVG